MMIESQDLQIDDDFEGTKLRRYHSLDDNLNQNRSIELEELSIESNSGKSELGNYPSHVQG